MTSVLEKTNLLEGKAYFPAGKKIYVRGSRLDIQVLFRVFTLTHTESKVSRLENPPLRLYDTSGPYSQEGASLDVRHGLATIHRGWILERGDVEEFSAAPTAANGSEDAQSFPGLERRPLKAKAGRAVSQLHYALR